MIDLLIIFLLILIGLVCLVLLIIAWIWGGYNVFVTGDQNIKTMWSNIKTEYQRRADLFYNLVEATKSAARFERDTLTQVIAMRNGNFGNTVKENIAKMKKLNTLFSQLQLIVERYPKLKATEEYAKLMEETRNTEDRVNIVRTEYNDVVRDYNLSVRMFPSSLLAGMFHFKEHEYFENEEGTDKAPKFNLKL